MNIFRKIFQGKEKRCKTPRVSAVYVFFTCPKGGELENSQVRMRDIDSDFKLRLLENDEFAKYWIEETQNKYGDAKITLFDIDEWDAPELNVWSLEGDLPSLHMGSLVRQAVRKALLSRGVQSQVVEKCCEHENEERLYQSHPGLVIWWFKYPEE